MWPRAYHLCKLEFGPTFIGDLYLVVWCMWCNWSLQCQFWFLSAMRFGVVWRLQATYIPLVVTSDCIFQTRSLPREAPRRPREGLAKAENIHNTPVISISRFDFCCPPDFYNAIVFFRFFIFSQGMKLRFQHKTRTRVCRKNAKATAKAIFKQKSTREGTLRSKIHPA